MMRLVIVGVACAALGFALASYLQARALTATVEEMREQVELLSVEGRDRHTGSTQVRTIVEQRIVAATEAAPAVVQRPPEPSAAERFDHDSVRDPRRRSDMVSVMRNASVDVDDVECNSTTCVLAATVPTADTARFVEAVCDAIGAGVQFEMVYESAGAGSQRVTIYAR